MSIKSYPATWEGNLLLACRKCQRKLKGEPGMRVLARLKKTIKRNNKKHSLAPLHVIGVPCFDLCPKGGVTVCVAATQPPALSVLRHEDDIEALYPRP